MGVPALSAEWLENAADNNGDGTGIVVRNKAGELQVNKSFIDKEFIEFGSAWGEDYEVVAHARIATSGRKDVANLHPFPIYKLPVVGDPTLNDEVVAYLFHNGIVDVPFWNKEKSDTWHLARIWEASFGRDLNIKMRQRGWRRRQKKRFASGYANKFVLIDKEGVAIINPTAGLWKNGVWHSNDTALVPPYYNSKYWNGNTQYEWEDTGRVTWRVREDGSYLADTTDYEAPYGEQERLLPRIGKNYPTEAEINSEFLLDEWLKDNRIQSIEETLYEYDAAAVARAVKQLLRSTGIALDSDRLGASE